MNQHEAYTRIEHLLSSLERSKEKPAIGPFIFNERKSWSQTVLDEEISFKQGIDDEYVVQEEAFIASVDHLPDLIALKNSLKENIRSIAHPSRRHNHTHVLIIYIVSSLDPNEERAIQRFSYRKTFALSFHGVADVSLIVWDASQNRLVVNRLGRAFAKKHGPSLLAPNE